MFCPLIQRRASCLPHPSQFYLNLPGKQVGFYLVLHVPADVRSVREAYLNEFIIASSAASKRGLSAALKTPSLWSGSSVQKRPQSLWSCRDSSWQPHNSTIFIACLSWVLFCDFFSTVSKHISHIHVTWTTFASILLSLRKGSNISVQNWWDWHFWWDLWSSFAFFQFSWPDFTNVPRA